MCGGSRTGGQGGIFGSKGKEEVGGGTSLNKAVRHDFYSSSHIFRAIKSRRIIGVKHRKGKQILQTHAKPYSKN